MKLCNTLNNLPLRVTLLELTAEVRHADGVQVEQLLRLQAYVRLDEIVLEDIQKVIDELQLEELLVHNHKHQAEVVGQPPLHHVVFAVEVLVGRPLLYQPLLDQFVQHVELQLAECHLEEKHAASREHARHVNHN